jgi:peptidyl-prolyl cis-trans isomerase D
LNKAGGAGIIPAFSLSARILLPAAPPNPLDPKSLEYCFMLRFFAKFERSKSIVLFSFCLILLIGLIAFYIPNSDLVPGADFGASSAEGKTVIAKVGSQEITLREFSAQLAAMGQQFGRGNTLPPATMKALGMDKQVLDNLIANALTLDQAAELNLVGTDGEISNAIRSQFQDANGAFVGKEEYIRRVRLSGMEVEEFEDNIRRNLASAKIRNFLGSSQQVSDRDVEEDYKRDNTLVEVVYAAMDLEKVRKSGYNPTDQELQSYYDGHKDEFKANEPTYKVDYAFISTDDVAKTVPVTEEELKTEYDARKYPEFRASVIKLNVPAPADENTVSTKINELNTRVRGAQGVAPEDFATVAKGNSQDPSAKSGGDIGWIKKDANKPGQWRQRVYTNGLKAGDIDGPFRDGSSWYVMKVTEQRDVSFAEMRETLKATVQNNKAFRRANELANDLYAKATESKDLRKAAAEIAPLIKVSADSMLKTTPYFKKGDPLKDLGKGGSGAASNPQFEEAIAALKKDEIGDKVQIPGGFAVSRLTDLLDKGAQLTFEQARNQVENAVRKEKEPNMAKARAEELLKQAKDAADLERLMKADGLEVKTDTNFNNYTFPGAAAGGLQASNQARGALMALKTGEVAKSPIKVGAAYLIFGATKRTEADLSKLKDDRKNVRASLLSERQQAAYDAYVKAARKRYEDQGRIKIYQNEIDKFFDRAAAAQAQ